MNPAQPDAGAAYDAVPYESLPFAQCHPDRLATLARLFGLQAPPIASCRVLELGCAGGGNLIPMAVALPQARFVGVDLSPVQVAQGRRIIDALGLRNIELHARSILELDASLGRFDYILTHGVYSWVPDAVQEKILSVSAAQLTPEGVAYVSYNTLPGWRMRGMVRDLMRYHAGGFTDPAQRVGQARAILDFLSASVPAQGSAYGMLLQTELDNLRRSPDYYILHEHLEEINEPLYFHRFAERAARHGLQYLGEAEFSTMLASTMPAEIGRTLAQISGDVIQQEQFMDFLRNRTFRQTLLVHGGRAIRRNVLPERVQPLWVSGRLSPALPNPDLRSHREESFVAPGGGSLKTPNPVTKAALVVLARAWPRALAFEDLLQEALALCGERAVADPASAGVAAQGAVDAARQVLASDVLQCFIAELLQLHAGPSPFVVEPGVRPQASPLVRWQAAQGVPYLTTLRHEPVQVDAVMRRLLQLLDGSRDADAVRADWARTDRMPAPANASGRPLALPPAPTGERLPALVDQLARSALLLG